MKGEDKERVDKEMEHIKRQPSYPFTAYQMSSTALMKNIFDKDVHYT
jgi:hypothetical protein